MDAIDARMFAREISLGGGISGSLLEIDRLVVVSDWLHLDLNGDAQLADPYAQEQ